MLGTVNL